MRRRRQRNPLLMRIIGISILAHILLLPVLAHFGAFKKIKQQFIVGEVKIVNLPPPPQVKPPDAQKKEAKAKPQKAMRTAKKASATTSHQTRASVRANLNQPKLALATGGSGGDAGGGVEQGTGKAGEIPTPKADVTQPTVKAPEQEPKTEPKIEPKPEPKTELVKPPIQIAKAVEPKPEPRPEPKPEPMPAPHVPVFTEAAQTFAPQPSIPDDLRSAALDKTVVVEITVDANGNSTRVRLMQPTGNDELDRSALDTARKWKFKPATRDGQPVESRVRLHIEFQVS